MKQTYVIRIDERTQKLTRRVKNFVCNAQKGRWSAGRRCLHVERSTAPNSTPLPNPGWERIYRDAFLRQLLNKVLRNFHLHFVVLVFSSFSSTSTIMSSNMRLAQNALNVLQKAQVPSASSSNLAAKSLATRRGSANRGASGSLRASLSMTSSRTYGTVTDYRPRSDDPNRPLTRDDFISPMTLDLATNLPVMYVLNDGAEGLSKVPTPTSIRDSGKIPEGYTIDFTLDPSRIIASLRTAGVTTIGQCPEDTLYEIRAMVNSPQNLSIVPTSVYEARRRREFEQMLGESSSSAPQQQQQQKSSSSQPKNMFL
ncbi:hypothetical protein D9758_009829 [Tetrapyrgos nigripes]|uniref:Uncharacterized protein n=1 Tax=Tetrapyrgos nigripes TaxID=182062 RepID=A0A8H5GMM0_9AGAR|nr:hypothetical protein D9758_009829 [Tetrapyrgos nigripes]